MAESHPPAGAVHHDGVEGWTTDGSSDDPALLDAATALLDLEPPDPRFVDSSYLHWAYRENPLGRAIERHQQIPDGDSIELVAHYVNVPRRYRGPDGVLTDGAWSLNAVVKTGHQRARHFQRLGLAIYDEAAANGWTFVIGVTNEKSTGAVVKYMGWKLQEPLPVKVIQPVGRGRGRRRGMTHRWVTDEWLDSAEFTDLCATVDRHPVEGWATDYSPEVLRWRLACPNTKYAAHICDDMLIITTRSSLGPIPACVVLKIFPLVGGSSVIDATRAIRTVTRWHRAGFAVYAGFNGSVTVRGITPPMRLRPSPLNLVVRQLDPSFDAESVKLDTFEFLDMDAY